MSDASFGARLLVATRRLSSVGVVLAVALSLLRFVDFDHGLLLGFAPLAPWAVAAVGLVFAATYGLRGFITGVLAIGAVAALWMPGTVLPRTGCDVPGAVDESSVLILSHNTLVGNRDSAGIIAQITEVNPDIVLLQEATPDFLELTGPELADTYPHTEQYALQAVFSRWPLTDVVTTGTSTGGALIATVERPNGPLRVANVHASAPTDPDRRVSQREEFTAMPTWRVEESVDIMMGDFNASAAHVIYRKVVSDGYTDAHRMAGCGFKATWTVRPGRGPAVLQLDHALVNGRWVATDFEVLDFANSDHKAIAVRIESAE